jgi:hypothetical protein
LWLKSSKSAGKPVPEFTTKLARDLTLHNPNTLMAGTFKIVMAVSSLIILGSCVSHGPEFTAYNDNTIFEGHGGVVRSVNGIELWTDGSPDRKFRILGVIAVKQETALKLPGLLNQLAQSGQLTQSSSESRLAAEAKVHGGDAVIIIQNRRNHDVFSDPENGTGAGNEAGNEAEFSQGETSPKHRHAREAYIVKYVEGGD